MGMIANLILAYKNRAKLGVIVTEAKNIKEAVQSTPKSGYFSSEFLTTVLGAALLIYNTLAPEHKIDPALSAELAAALAGLYVVARTGLKGVHTLGDSVKALTHAITPPATVVSVSTPPAA